MAEQRIVIGGVDDGPLYTIDIQDAPKEQNYTLVVGTSNFGYSDGIHVADVEAAVQAFADSVASLSPTAVVTNIKKTTVSVTAL